jgi:hypothetical protein
LSANVESEDRERISVAHLDKPISSANLERESCRVEELKLFRPAL